MVAVILVVLAGVQRLLLAVRLGVLAVLIGGRQFAAVRPEVALLDHQCNHRQFGLVVVLYRDGLFDAKELF